MYETHAYLLHPIINIFNMLESFTEYLFPQQRNTEDSFSSPVDISSIY